MKENAQLTPPVAISAQTGTVGPIEHLVTGRFSSLIRPHPAILDVLSATLPFQD